MVLTTHDILPDDIDVVISIRTGVFVPEPNHVSQFVHHNAKLVAIFPDADSLTTISTFTNKRTTTTRSFRENDVILMGFSVAFHKFYAGKVLPMPHCLFEQSFMKTAEISIWNLIEQYNLEN